MTPPLGIDVNYPVSWPQAAAAGVSWCYVKASEGRGYATSHYQRNVAAAAAACGAQASCRRP